MKKELKRQIKQDEFISGIGSAWAWATAHKQELRTLGLVVAVVAVIGFGLSWYQRNQDASARADWSAAMDTFHAPLESELVAGEPRPAGAVFASGEERSRKALAAFDGFARRFARHELAPRAQYYSALCHVQLDQLEAAEPLLNEVAARRDRGTLEPALALVALAGAYRAAGRYDDAVEAWRRLLEDSSSPLPRDQALMGLAENLERAERLAEARASYQRVIHEHPSSSYASEARRRAGNLERAS